MLTYSSRALRVVWCCCLFLQYTGKWEVRHFQSSPHNPRWPMTSTCLHCWAPSVILHTKPSQSCHGASVPHFPEFIFGHITNGGKEDLGVAGVSCGLQLRLPCASKPLLGGILNLPSRFLQVPRARKGSRSSLETCLLGA